MYWNGERWLPQEPQRLAETQPPRRRFRDWAATGIMVVALAGLAIPILGATAATTSGTTLIANWSAASNVAVVQESNLRIAYTGKWTIAKHNKYLGGKAESTNAVGATATLKFKGDGIAWVGPIGPTRGKARVYVDGALVATVNTWADRFGPTRVLFKKTWASVRWHRIKIVSSGTAGHPTVALDAFVQRRGPKSTVTATPTPSPTSAVTATPTPVSTPTPTPTTGSSGIYGTAYNMDSLANMQVGGTSSGAPNTYVSYRFRASQSSKLVAFRVYWIGAGYPGYSGGTGGTVRVTLQTDSGGVPSGNVLATRDIVHPPSDFPLHTFGTPPALTAGALYHLVFTNIDPQPTVNFVSVDLTYVFGTLSPRQPKWPDSDYAGLQKFGSGSWAVQGGFTPIMDLTYGNGVHQGQGYMEVEAANRAVIAGSTSSVRERFTVSGGSRVVTGAAVRIAKTSGSGDLVVRLENANGAVIDSFSVSTDSVPIPSSGFRGIWLSGSFATPRTLANGATYSVRLSTDSSTSLWTRGIQQGDGYSFDKSTYFADGMLEVTSNGGSSWSSVSGLGSSGDLQFYLR